MPIENTIQFGAAQAANRPAVQPEAAPAEASKPTAVLDGPNVRVSVTGTQLDKLVAKVKSESEDARLDAAKRRIAIVLIALRTLNLQMTESQKNGLAQLEVLQGQLDSLSDLLNGKTSNLSAAELRAAELQAKIEELTKAVENAVEEGKEHRKRGQNGGKEELTLSINQKYLNRRLVNIHRFLKAIKRIMRRFQKSLQPLCMAEAVKP